MTDKSTFNREALARTVGLVRPALATRDYIPALTHILFAGGRATAYNDVGAISVRTDLDLGRCVPGAALVGALGSFGGAEVLVQDGKDGGVAVKCGRGTVRLPTLPAKDFPYDPPKAADGHEVVLTREVVRAVERCLMSVGPESGHPALSGVTMESDGGVAVLYSTDGATISRCSTSAKVKLPGGAPVVMPRFFCEQLVGLSKAFPEDELFLVIHDGALQLDLGESATLFTRTPVDVTPLDYPRVFAKHCDLAAIKDQVFDIPDAFDGALGRALLVLGDERAKVAKVDLKGGVLRMTSGSGAGTADDDMKYDAGSGDPKETLRVDPALLARGAKVCARMGFTDKVTVFADSEGAFVHIVAHVAPV